MNIIVFGSIRRRRNDRMKEKKENERMHLCL